jgi:signal transduction histidine kinase
MNQQSAQVVMVEDIPRYHPIYEEAIREAIPGAEVQFATDGLAALELIRNLPRVDLIILDLNIPKMHGSQVLAELRGDSRFDGIPIMILTGDSDKDVQSQLLEKGADDFIEKGAPPPIFIARLRAQMRHKLAINQLTQLAMDMDIFTAGVLHDIRNIETSISALCDLIRMQIEEDPIGNRPAIIADVQGLKGQAQRMSSYAGNILQNLKQTSSQPTVESVDPRQMVQWVMSMLDSSKPSSGTEARTIDINVAGELKSVMADRHLLELVFLNLCQNSIRYARPGIPAVIQLTQRPAEAQVSSGRVRIVTCLRDNGIGIPKDDLRRVFQPFVRSQSAGGAKHKGGFGLGLALVTKAVSMMGGRVWAELPNDGQAGIVMCVELPVSDAK